MHSLPNIDVCEYHDNSPNAAMPGGQWNGLQVRIKQCNTLNKPLFIGEVGIRPVDVPGGGFADRAAALEAKIDAQMGVGIDGILSWAWSNLGSTLNNYDIGPGDPALGVLALFIDSDGDGCADAAELQTAVGSETTGGRRSHVNFWDFYDTPDAFNVRDKIVDLFGDIFRVSVRFDANDLGGTALINRNSDPLSAPPVASAYHPAFDRSNPAPGDDPWDTRAPDGVITLFDDIFRVARQFDHNCN